jgi:hypothetical protein
MECHHFHHNMGHFIYYQIIVIHISLLCHLNRSVHYLNLIIKIPLEHYTYHYYTISHLHLIHFIFLLLNISMMFNFIIEKLQINQLCLSSKFPNLV